MAYDTDNFQKDVIERSHHTPVLVDFWAEWCGPCRFLSPTLERMAASAQGRWELAKLNTEVHQEIAARYGIRSIPNCKLFVDGMVVDEFVGALPEAQIRDFFKRALPSAKVDQIAYAQQLISDGKEEKAAFLLEDVVEAEPDNDQALFLLAQAYLEREPRRAIAAAGQIPPGSDYYQRAESIAALSTLYGYVQDPDSLPDAPVKEPFLQAIVALKAGDPATAAESLVNCVRMDRRYYDDAPRRACIALFQFLGDGDPVTQKFRPLFANALFV